MKNISISATLFNNEKTDNEHSNTYQYDYNLFSRVLACKINVLCWHNKVKLLIIFNQN